MYIAVESKATHILESRLSNIIAARVQHADWESRNCVLRTAVDADIGCILGFVVVIVGSEALCGFIGCCRSR